MKGIWGKVCLTRMHSSRMRTARSSSRPGGGLNQAPSPRDQTPLGPGNPPPGSGTPPDQAAPLDQAPPREQTQTCKHITLPQTSFAGGKNFEKLTIFSDALYIT